MEKIPIGTYVEIDGQFWEIVGREPFWYETTAITAEFAALVTGTNSGFVQIANLQPRQQIQMLIYVLWAVSDGCTYFLQRPSGTSVMGVDRDQDAGYLDATRSHPAAFNEDYAFFIVTKDAIAIRANNDTGYTVTPKVFFTGMKYDIDPIVDAKLIKQLNAREVPYRKIPRGVRSK